MDSSIFRISLDIHRQTTQTHLAVRKGDTARKIVAALSDGGRPYRIREGCYAVFRGKKPDGNVLYNDCAIINNCIVYEFTEQTAASAGHMPCELQLYGPDGKLITSPKFSVIVSGLAYDDSEVESSSEFTALAQAMTDLAELRANGLKGDEGDSAYDVAVGLGFEGSEAEWVESLRGPVGPEGPQGPKGDGNALRVIVSRDGEKYVADKTVSDIEEAESLQQPVYLQMTPYVLPLVAVDQASALFQMENRAEYMRVLVYADGSVKVEGGSYAKETDLKPPFYVQLTLETGAKVGTASHTYTDIKAAYDSGRDVLCAINGKIVAPLTNINSSLAVFQVPLASGAKERQITFAPSLGNNAQVKDIEYAVKADLDSYAKSTDLKPPFYVQLTYEAGANTGSASHSFAVIYAAHSKGQDVMCVINNSHILPLANISSTLAVFQGPTVSNTDLRVTFAAAVGDVAQVEELAYSLVRNATEEKYFDIDADGVISLKAEYKGSKMAELPEIVIIPQNIDGEKVSGFEEGMFCGNTRVKEIVIPAAVKALPNDFAKEAIYLEKLTNTEHLESIGTGALQQTRVNEIVCPNLTSLGGDAFRLAYCLRYADLGRITAIPDNAFRLCENLLEVKADHVTSIGKHSFYGTRRLKSLSCLPNVKSMGDGAFWSSRCDLEALPADCEFGTLSSYKQFNTGEYWDGVAFTPCKVPLGSLFSQYDPRWADREIKYTAADGTEYAYLDDTGNPCTYAENGCALFTLMAIYSAFTGTTFNDPDEFFPVLEEAGVLGKDFRKHSTWIEIANGLGFETELISEVTAESCKTIYDALLGGALLYRSTLGSFPSDALINAGIAANVLAQGTHAMLGYGINSDGEMLTSDTSMHGHKVGIPENHKTAWHIYKHGSELCDCVIVRKPN